MHVIYLPDEELWDQFFQNQIGGNPYFQGELYRRGVQYGTGIGSVLSSFMRFVVPIAKQIGAHLGREGLSFGSRVLHDLAEGEQVKPTLHKQTRQSAKNLAKTAQSVFQKGQGKRRKRQKVHSIVGRRLKVTPKSISSSKRDPFNSKQ